MTTALISTTINVPTVFELYAKANPDCLIIIAADKKTPPEAEDFIIQKCGPVGRTQFMTVEQQQDLGYESSELTGWNTDSRRNIALLEAIRSKAEFIVSCDDDMVPYGSVTIPFSWTLKGKFLGMMMGESKHWFNANAFSMPAAKARGLPVDELFVDNPSWVCNVDVGAAQGTIFGVPDTDAPTAITNRPFIHSASDLLKNGFVVSPDCYTVFNSQLTGFRAELAPAFAQFYKWQGRNTDIFASVLMRRIMKEKNLYTYFGPPMGFHARKSRPLLNDLKAEMYGLEHIKKFAEVLDATPIKGLYVVDDCRTLMSAANRNGVLADEALECAMAFYLDAESVL